MPENPESPFGFGNPSAIHSEDEEGKLVGPIAFIAARLRRHPIGASVCVLAAAILVSIVVM